MIAGRICARQSCQRRASTRQRIAHRRPGLLVRLDGFKQLFFAGSPRDALPLAFCIRHGLLRRFRLGQRRHQVFVQRIVECRRAGIVDGRHRAGNGLTDDVHVVIVVSLPHQGVREIRELERIEISAGFAVIQE